MKEKKINAKKKVVKKPVKKAEKKTSRVRSKVAKKEKRPEEKVKGEGGKVEKEPKKKVERKEKVAEKEEKPKEKIGEKEEIPKKEKKPKVIEKIKYHKIKELPDDLARLLKKKPKFARQELRKRVRLKDKWRAPRGIDSKKHLMKRGKGKVPKIGYKKPESVRGLTTKVGFHSRIVKNPDDLVNVNPKSEAIIIAKCVGRKKRNEIIKSANGLKITILNPRKGEI